MTEQPTNKRNLKLEFPRDPSAIYANMVMITHTANEVIFDFIQLMPNDDRARVQKRVMMTPTHSKLFMKALEENLAKFEAKHGEIPIPSRPTLADQLFGGLRGKPADEDDE
ncbi:MAG: DUF3467 domain-containing protein [Chloroflexi bacterium]|nr:DUF3467 domain-containing protein [Chloroflexota bacterium]MCY4248581.1 DUF3467 domain-containing protein [Chloroflexota bacterium]